MNIEISEAEISTRVYGETISYFSQGGDSLNRETAKECLSQILTNAYNLQYDEVKAQVDARFEGLWNSA